MLGLHLTACPAPSVPSRPVPSRPTAPQSPAVVMQPDRTYTFCIYARLGGDAAPGTTVNTSITLASVAGWATKGTTAVALTTSWRQFCIENTKGSAVGVGHYFMPLGVAKGTYHVDDASLLAYAA